jgi:hypothetical protein
VLLWGRPRLPLICEIGKVTLRELLVAVLVAAFMMKPKVSIVGRPINALVDLSGPKAKESTIWLPLLFLYEVRYQMTEVSRPCSDWS